MKCSKQEWRDFGELAVTFVDGCLHIFEMINTESCVISVIRDSQACDKRCWRSSCSGCWCCCHWRVFMGCFDRRQHKLTISQRILTRGRLAGEGVFSRSKLMWHRPVGGSAVGYSNRADAIIDFLLRTSQQWLSLRQPAKLLLLSGNLDRPSNTWFLGPTRVTHQTASRSVPLFLQRARTRLAIAVMQPKTCVQSWQNTSKHYGNFWRSIKWFRFCRGGVKNQNLSFFHWQGPVAVNTGLALPPGHDI